MNAHFNKASELYQEGLVDEAVKELKRSIDLEPGEIKPYLTLAAIYEARGQNEEAIGVYRKAIHIDMDDSRANLRLGVILTHLKRYEDALTPLRMAWSNDRYNARAANALARALDESGDYSTAQIMYEEVLKLDSGFAEARFNLATLRFNEHRYESAITEFVKYMAKAGESSKAHRNIGKALVQLGQLDSAIGSFNTAASLDPSDPTIYFNLGLAYNCRDDYETAFENYRHALVLDPHYVEARYTLAKALKDTGHTAESLAEYELVLQEFPNHHRAMNGLATCCLAQHDSERALELLGRAISQAPESALAHYNLGLALNNLEQFDEALHHFQEASRLDPSDNFPHQATFSRLLSGNMSYRLSAA